jgi:hypothetical protein
LFFPSFIWGDASVSHHKPNKSAHEIMVHSMFSLKAYADLNSDLVFPERMR